MNIYKKISIITKYSVLLSKAEIVFSPEILNTNL